MKIRLIGTALCFALAGAGAGCASTSPSYSSTYPPPVSSSTNCYDCGTVTRVEVVSGTTSSVPNATGAVVGGIVGGVAGHELTKDSSNGTQNAATVAGAVAGAVAGNAIQNHAQATGTYNVYVRMTAVFEDDLELAKRYTYETWKQRPWKEKFVERFILPIKSQL